MGKSNNILFESPHVTIVFRGAGWLSGWSGGGFIWLLALANTMQYSIVDDFLGIDGFEFALLLTFEDL